MKIILKHLDFFARHGVYAQERQNGNKFRVNITLELPEPKGCQTDKIEDTINYEEVYNIVKKEMSIPSNLLEHVAFRIKKALKYAFPQLTNIQVQVGKHTPPLGGSVEWSYIEL